MFTVRSSTERFAGTMFSVVTDDVEMPGGEVAQRDYMRHIGSVGVVPYDEDGRVVLVRQYRHPLRRPLWELPAGLIDIAGESLPEVAARELAEETDLAAGRLELLIDLHPSPGCSNERIRIFLARDLSPAPHRHDRTHEEATMTAARFPLDDAVKMIFDGQITNAAAAGGVLAAARARDSGWSLLPAA